MNDPRPPAGEPSVALVAELDRLQLRAWPAAHEETLAGWQLRFTGGVTRRANSVLPHGPAPPDIDAALARVDAAYTERDLDPRFLVSPAASPPTLDTLLAERGYAAEAVTLVQTASLPLQPLTAPEAIEVNVGAFDEAWLSAYAAAESLTLGEVEGRRGIHRRIRADAGYVTARIDGKAAGVGSVVVEDGWAGVHNMATEPEHRRRGAARAVLLLAWASGRGATGSYLAGNQQRRPRREAPATRPYRYWYRAKRHVTVSCRHGQTGVKPEPRCRHRPQPSWARLSERSRLETGRMKWLSPRRAAYRYAGGTATPNAASCPAYGSAIERADSAIRASTSSRMARTRSIGWPCGSSSAQSSASSMNVGHAPSA